MSTAQGTEAPTRRARRSAAVPATEPAGAAAHPASEPSASAVGAAETGTLADATVPTVRMAREAGRIERWREDAGRVLGPAWRVARDVVAVVRPLGWIVLGLAVSLWIVALTLGWEEVLIAAAVVTAILALCVPFLFGRTTYEVGLDLTRTHVVVGERAVGALNLANRTSRALLPSEVVLPVGSGRGLFQVPRLAPGAEHEELFAIPTQRRGVLSVGPVSVLRGDPLGLFERTHDRRHAVDLFVHPRTTTLDGLSLGHLRDLEGLPVQHLSRDDVSFHALREYQPGDDLRHVHWKSTARVGALMVRQYEETRRSHFIVALSTSPDEYRTPDEFELAVSVAGSIGLRAIRDSRTLEARTQRGALRAPTARRFLDGLSALEHSRSREGGIAALAGSLAAVAPQAAVAVLVTGGAADAAELRVACARLPFGVRVVAVVADDRVSSPSLRRIGDADVVTLGELDQLPSAVRKVLS
ncbi:DUF58 domain-containing protein [Microbacterium telephonicum]|uniref:Uncharacterized protein (DUF58 family) n=1 Tax=Microbacterium telephonicum TaxID=1714841 RepID=A0A498CA39_9MICO|nr:DUF58 domain-containing protein [Microbacterium telephonicum]RLK52373.1 uncharacterized protein (DUF58 family) [Microbacterium telephonicum]